MDYDEELLGRRNGMWWRRRNGKLWWDDYKGGEMEYHGEGREAESHGERIMREVERNIVVEE